MNLVIVESPAKSKTISKYLGDEYVIRPSVGHIKDLPKSNKDAIDIAAGFIPRYETIKGKEKIIEEIKKFAGKADEVILATDPDREGEAIAWHIAQVLDMRSQATNTSESTKIIEKELSYKLGGIFFGIQKELGRFCRERQYADALEKKLKEKKINFKREYPIEIADRKSNFVDFFIEDKVLVDIKAKPFVKKDDYYQMKRYLEISGIELGLIVNFQSKYLKPNRILNLADSDRVAVSDKQKTFVDSDKFVVSNRIKRIVFHEITESAIKEALKNPRDIDMDLVKAQEARRVLDRLVGYDLSGLIWKKVRYGLSAGRVQSPALRIIMEREREIRAFVSENYWVIEGEFETECGEKIILVCEEQPRDEKEAERIIKISRENKNKWRVTNITQNETKRAPKPPFITSTLQQAASSRLGFSPSRTMLVAQKLYEQGLITYMRTDSVNIAKEALGQIYKEIEKQFGKEYVAPRVYETKSKSAQEAHEAIRPTKISRHQAGAKEEQQKLYRLIWQRTMACQMADANILRTKISANVIDESKSQIANRKDEYKIPNFSATGSIVVFPGWLKADIEARGEDVELPKLKQDESLKLLNIASEGKQTEPPLRYTEAGLIKELEKREIGRPSTYATIMKTIIDRGYVIKDGRILKPTDTGEVVSDFLEKNFAKYISDSFTAEMENELDEIAQGKRKYETMLSDFYGPFSKEVENKGKTAKKITDLGNAPDEYKCPACGGPMVVKLSRTGKFLSCKKFPKCGGALKIDGTEIAGPKETGEMCPKCQTGKLVEREGRFGKFIACSNYPKCKFAKTSAEEEVKARIGIKCPKCSMRKAQPSAFGLGVSESAHPNKLNMLIGEIITKRTKKGRIFYGCSNYPNCDFALWDKPINQFCEKCGAIMTEKKKGIICSNRECK